MNDIQWYPGHMTKALRQMQEDIRLVDLVVEMTDARCPMAGRNPDIARLSKDRTRIMVLTKADLADPDVTAKWLEAFEADQIPAAALDVRSRKDMRRLMGMIEEAGAARRDRDKARGITGRRIRVMVAGIPNVGKSTLINSLAGRASAKTGDRPGVTRGAQWVRFSDQMELLDTPGILWPKIDDRANAMKLAMVGTIRDEILPRDDVALELIRLLEHDYPQLLAERYGAGLAASEETGEDADDDMGSLIPPQVRILEQIARARGCIKKGGEPDYERACSLLIDDFRKGRIGRISLERPIQ